MFLKSRIVIIFIGFCLLWTLLIVRAASLQILPNDRLNALRDRQFKTVVTLQARRGAILDREGRDLALSTPAFSLYVDPKIIEAPRSTSKKLAKILGVKWTSIYSKIKNKNRRFVWLERRMTPDKADAIKALGVRGVSFVEEWRRVYPNESVLAQTLGFLGGEGQALEGIELAYDSTLRGNLKKVVVRRDARGRPLVADGLLFQQNPDGHDIKLTIDSELQYMLESELSHAVREFEAGSAVGIVLDAKTSAIRAMASVPTFDANKAGRVSAEIRRNRAVMDAFEPGSTLKPFVVASALKAKQLQPNSKYFAENGSYKIGKRTIRDDVHKYGWLSVSEILSFSSNIGTAKIAFQLGAKPYRETLLDFGFGGRTGADLPGEAKGTVQDLPWGDHLLSNISFGHGISTTPLQMANGFAALVNGGSLNVPYIVEGVRDAETGSLTETEPKTLRTVLSPEQSSQMRLMLTGVTAPGGTGVNAKVNGFIVGGKTGTAQKVDPNGRGYLRGAYISSFAGFIPAHDPRFVIYIAVDHPKKSYYGSQVAAPIFSKIASYAVRKEGLAPLLLSERNLIHRKVDRAIAKANQSKDPLAEINASAETLTEVPDFTRLTLREVLQQMSGKDIKLKWIGRKGTVQESIPRAGEPLPENQEITIILK